MKNIGINGSKLALFNSYLSCRNQIVKINSTYSDTMNIKCALRDKIIPILFNIQLNDIQHLPIKSNVVCFADDTVLVRSGNT